MEGAPAAEPKQINTFERVPPPAPLVQAAGVGRPGPRGDGARGRRNFTVNPNKYPSFPHTSPRPRREGRERGLSVAPEQTGRCLRHSARGGRYLRNPVRGEVERVGNSGRSLS